MREREKSRMTPRFFSQTTGKMELSLTERERTAEGAGYFFGDTKFEMLSRHPKGD